MWSRQFESVVVQVVPILNCVSNAWSPSIGDPTWIGWITVVGYLSAAIFSLRLGGVRKFKKVERIFWSAAGVGLLFLAVNKQLDLQSAITAIGRCHAQLQGWYDDRRAIQIDLILGLVFVSLFASALLMWMLRGTLHRTGIGLAGIFIITSFVLVRAVGFHHVDRLIGMDFGHVRINWLLELGGILVFIIGCCKAFAVSDE